MRNKNNVIYAGFFVRLVAYIVDCIIVNLLLIILKIPKFILSVLSPDNILEVPIFFKFSVWDILSYIVFVSYFVLLVYITGTTVGKRLLRLEVIDTDGDRPDFLTLLYRETIGRYLSYISFGIGYIVIIIDAQKRGFHDMLSDTRVVYNLRQNVAVYNKETAEVKKQNLRTSIGKVYEELPSKKDVLREKDIEKQKVIEDNKNIGEKGQIDKDKNHNVNESRHDFADEVVQDKNERMRKYQKLKELVISEESEAADEISAASTEKSDNLEKIIEDKTRQNDIQSDAFLKELEKVDKTIQEKVSHI